MDSRVINQKLESLRRSIQRVKEKLPETAQQLQNNHDLQDIISLNLSRAVQTCVDIASHIISDSELPAPTTMGETFQAINKLAVIDDTTTNSLKKAVGFRNIVVHSYETIDWDIVYAIACNHLDDFKAFATAVDLQVNKQNRN